MDFKPTGIIRRIDDLGRIVLPRELRRKIGVREGDPMEWYTNGEYFILKKYKNYFLQEKAEEMVETFESIRNNNPEMILVVTDDKSVIAVSKNKLKVNEGIDISSKLLDKMLNENAKAKNKGPLLRGFGHLSKYLSFEGDDKHFEKITIVGANWFGDGKGNVRGSVILCTDWDYITPDQSNTTLDLVSYMLSRVPSEID